MGKPTDLCSHCKQGVCGIGTYERRDILDNNFCFFLSVFCLCACSSVCTPPPSPCPLPLLQEFPSCSYLIFNPSSYCLLLRSDTALGNHVAEEGCYKYSWTLWAGREESERGTRRRRGRKKESAGTGQVGVVWGEREKGRISRECGGRALCQNTRWF